MVMARTFGALAQVTEGRLIGPDREFGAVISDSRRMEAEALFVCLRGPRFDGHDYTEAAAGAGAAGFLGEREVAPELTRVEVEDTRIALQRFARAWRAAQDARVIAITGSNGKTTTKDLLAAIFAQVAPTLATSGNFNNLIGVPLTLVRLNAGHRYAVVELGSNAAGEIAALAAIAQPDVALVTSIGPAHLAGFGSIEGVAREKGSLFAALDAGGLAVAPAGASWLAAWQSASAARRWISFGLDADAQVTAHSIEPNSAGIRFTLVTPGGSAAVSLRLLGRHNVINALAAAAAAWGLGVAPDTIARGLALVAPAAGRLTPLRLAAGALLLNDSYNANPASVSAAVAAAVSLGPNVWLVLGDLGELGSGAPDWHRQVGREARAAGATRLYALGPLAAEAAGAFGEDAVVATDAEALAAELKRQLAPDVVVVVKGSRSAHMEHVVAALTREDG